MKEYWDQRYSEEGFAYGREPNQFFRETLDTLKPGSLFLPGEGEGRNAIYAARKEWAVTANDQSSVARDKALAWAQEEKLELEYDLVQLEKMPPCKDRYDAAAIIYLHFPSPLRTKVFRQITDCLKPGGTLILECFHKNQLKYGTGGPPVLELLYNKENLQEDFNSLDISLCNEYKVDIFEGKYHSGTSSVIRLVAKKPI